MSQPASHPPFKNSRLISWRLETEGEHQEDEVRGSGKNGSRKVFGKLYVVRHSLNRTPSEKETNEDQGKQCQGLMRLSSEVVVEICRLMQRGAAYQWLRPGVTVTEFLCHSSRVIRGSGFLSF